MINPQEPVVLADPTAPCVVIVRSGGYSYPYGPFDDAWHAWWSLDGLYSETSEKSGEPVDGHVMVPLMVHVDPVPRA